jgi:hypothetical protein
MTALRTDDAHHLDERRTLLWFLDEYRRVLSRKIEGLDDADARRRACPPSDLSLLGLIRHMADVERGWFRRGLGAEDVRPIHYGAAHPDGDEDGDFHAPAGATVEDALATYWAEIGVADRIIAAAPSLDAPVANARRGSTSLRWILVHMIEEYARHCGHADLLRQAVDGATGD